MLWLWSFQQDANTPWGIHSFEKIRTEGYGADVVADALSAKGRADLTLKMPCDMYILGLEYADTAVTAIKQIGERGYARKYAMDGRPVIKVGQAFSQKERNIAAWTSNKYFA